MAFDTSKIEAGPCQVEINAVAIGHTQGGCVVRHVPDVRARVVDKYGSSPVDHIHQGEGLEVDVPLAQTELAVLDEVFPLGTLVASTYKAIGNVPGTQYSGQAQSLELIPLTGSAGATEEDKRFLMHNAVVIGGVEYGFTPEGDRIYAVTFVGEVDTDKSDGDLMGRQYHDS